MNPDCDEIVAVRDVRLVAAYNGERTEHKLSRGTNYHFPVARCFVFRLVITVSQNLALELSI